MLGNGNRIPIAAGLALLLLAPAGVRAQESGTRLSQTLTLVKTATNPAFGVNVAGFKGAGTNTRMFIEIGPDGNTASPAPNPSLPGTARVLVIRGTDTITFTPPATGSVSNNSTFTGKNVALDRSVENAADARGLYRLTIGHVTGDIEEGNSEQYTVVFTNVPSGMRIIASIDQGTFTSLTPSGPCGASCPAGQSCQAPCPGVCAPGTSCRGPCPLRPCLGPIRIYEIPEIKFPPGPGPECLSCPMPWRQDFDRSRFERVLMTFVPTNEQRLELERAQTTDLRFDVRGGEAIGEVLEGSGGEFMQMVQQPIGEPAEVAVMANGATIAETRAEVALSDDARTYRGIAYGLGGILALAIGALAMQLRGRTREGRFGDMNKG